ncbi:MAG: VOC family protein [Pyrinomonadaceae bacterium]|nr:VOC family protein [Pyrinomonadaceae bacterium]
MFQGLRTVIHHVGDLAAAKQWYSRAFGVEPYFDEPFYVGFQIGGFEFGLDPDMSGVAQGTNVVAYWGVTNIDEAYERMLTLGATGYNAVQDVGGGIRVAVVTDPFGNLFGIIENPHFRNSGD